MGPGSIVVRNNPLINIRVPAFKPTTFVQGQWVDGTYNHTRRAMGGFWDMSFTIEGSRLQLEQQVQDFLGKEVVVYSGDGQRVVWAGMITGLNLSVPNMVVKYSLDQLVNAVWARYTLASGGVDMGITAQVYDAITATRTQSEAASGGATFATSGSHFDNESIKRWGIKEGVLQLGLCPTAAVADYAAQVYLDKYYNPQPTLDVRAGALTSGRPQLQIIASGWFRTLYWQTYNWIDVPILRSVETMVDRITTLSAQYIQNVYTSTSGLTVTDQYGMDRTAADCLLDLARLGKSNGARKLVWVDENRDFYYKSAIRGNSYGRVKYRVSIDKGHRVITDQNGWVDPSEVQPRQWILAEDILNYIPIQSPDVTAVGQLLVNDPRVAYIEEVRFQEPNQVTLIPSVSGQLENLMAYMTMMAGLNSM